MITVNEKYLIQSYEKKVFMLSLKVSYEETTMQIEIMIITIKY